MDSFAEKEAELIDKNRPKRDRISELQRAAARLLAASGADVFQGVAIRPLARAMMKQTGCDYRTALRHIELAILQARDQSA